MYIYSIIMLRGLLKHRPECGQDGCGDAGADARLVPVESSRVGHLSRVGQRSAGPTHRRRWHLAASAAGAATAAPLT